MHAYTTPGAAPPAAAEPELMWTRRHDKLLELLLWRWGMSPPWDRVAAHLGDKTPLQAFLRYLLMDIELRNVMEPPEVETPPEWDLQETAAPPPPTSEQPAPLTVIRAEDICMQTHMMIDAQDADMQAPTVFGVEDVDTPTSVVIGADTPTSMAIGAETADMHTLIVLGAEEDVDMSTSTVTGVEDAHMSTSMVIGVEDTDMQALMAIKGEDVDMQALMAIGAEDVDIQALMAIKVKDFDMSASMVIGAEHADMLMPSANSGETIIIDETSNKKKRGGARKKPEIWTLEEHRLFLAGIEKHGKGKWKTLAREFVKTKSSTQIASHYQKFTIRGEKRQLNLCKRKSIHDITAPPPPPPPPCGTSSVDK
ncbi:hypothetical protein GUJ93_ZPchr0010g9512 [Zizania palustris]|uniref:Uncharacterized protein n=1 Tax=Zizania palustris TaxID=103762 RepID=A0A8J5W8I1_ZIZPA|nr:hypothetical protein GUJ93_ZPchr0010g9512 [Zizania palustris]